MILEAPHQPSDQPKTLDRLRVGQRGTVAEITGQTLVRRRLLEMGLCTGTEVSVLRRAPLGDPIEVKVRGYLLSLRANEARQVVLQ